MRVSQILCAAGPVDAVTNQGLAWRTVFSAWGWEGEDYAGHMAPGLPPHVLRPLRRFEDGGGVVLFHYSGHVAGLERLMQRTPRSLLLSHNITPARFFWPDAPVDAARCALARYQLADLATSAGTVAGVSGFNAQELQELSGREADVIPVLFERPEQSPPDGLPVGPPTILFVGRMVPHKRQDLVIRAFARLWASMPEARLVLVGVPLSAHVEGSLRALAEELAPGAVTFETAGISRERLAQYYRSAHVFLCLSEHEGFCIPLLEAFHYGVPVIARDAGAISEVVSDAGILLGPGDGLGTVAELLRIVIGDDELRQELRRRGERRLSVFDSGRTQERMREHLESLAAR